MAEPTSTASGGVLAAFAIALVGPAAGEYAVILLCALVGSMWPLGQRDDLSRAKGAMLVVKLVGTSAALTAFVAFLAQQFTGWPLPLLLAPVAFFIAAIGNSWLAVIGAVAKRVIAIVSGAKQ